MTFTDWQHVAFVAFVFGMLAGVILAFGIGWTALKGASRIAIVRSATRISECAYLRAKEAASLARIDQARHELDIRERAARAVFDKVTELRNGFADAKNGGAA